jgi:2-oxoglutarate ferredoxin oxidoreductase subunit beta
VPSIVKPVVTHPGLERNALGLTIRDYEGGMSTLCAGCGHDSVTAAITHALWESDTPPHMIAKLSGIGCSAKTAAYFARGAHGFNGCHGRMPPIATGASAANRDLLCIGISGDGDSLSIGLGHLAHLVRRNVRMVYVIENNGVYGLTKGQFSATADKGSKSKTAVNSDSPIDMVGLALILGATFVARSFSGDKKQLVPLLKAAIAHRGSAFIDIVSPCVQFNNNPQSTKSYEFVREHNDAVNRLDFMEPRAEIKADYEPGTVTTIEQHDGSILKLSKLDPAYDPHDKAKAMAYLQERHAKGEVVTGLLYLEDDAEDIHRHLNTVDTPLNRLSEKELCPGSAKLAAMNDEYR